jgi:hypothetical protein
MEFDIAWWEARFTAQWPEGSPAYERYLAHITGGPPRSCGKPSVAL